MNLEQLGPILGPILLIMATLASCVLVALRILDKRTEKKNGKLDFEMIPGHSPTCQINREAITKLVANQEFIGGQIKEINLNVGRLWKHRNGKDLG